MIGKITSFVGNALFWLLLRFNPLKCKVSFKALAKANTLKVRNNNVHVFTTTDVTELETVIKIIRGYEGNWRYNDTFLPSSELRFYASDALLETVFLGGGFIEITNVKGTYFKPVKTADYNRLIAFVDSGDL